MAAHHQQRVESGNAKHGGLFLTLAVGVPLLVFLAVIAVGYDGGHYLRGDCPYYVAAARSIAEDGDLDISNQLTQPWQRHSSHISLDRMGRFVPKHPLWMSIVSIPFLAVLGDRGALVFNLLQLAALSALAFAVACRIGRPMTAALATILTFTLSFLPHYALNFSPDVFIAVLFLGSILAVPEHGSSSVLRFVLCGLLIGFAATAKPSYLLAAAALPILVGKRWRCLPHIALGFMLPVTISLALNNHLFGHPLVTPYDRIVCFTPAGTEIHSNREDFNEPLWRGLCGQLLNREKGLLWTSPVTLAAFFGLPFLLVSHRRWGFFVAATSLSIVTFYSFYSLWPTSHWGNRFLMPVVVLAVLPATAALEAIIRRSPSKSRRSRAGPRSIGGP